MRGGGRVIYSVSRIKSRRRLLEKLIFEIRVEARERLRIAQKHTAPKACNLTQAPEYRAQSLVSCCSILDDSLEPSNRTVGRQNAPL